MTTEVKRLIQVRTDKGARFKRDGYGKKRQLSDSWRKPRGQHNKQREQKKAKGALPKPGFGSPVAVRGMHPSGFFEVLVTSLKDLEGLDPKTQAVRLGATVGTRKRAIIQEQAVSAGLKVLNARVVKTTKAKPAKAKPVKKDEVKRRPRRRPAVKPRQQHRPRRPAKKAASRSPRPEKTEEKAEKKAPAKKASSQAQGREDRREGREEGPGKESSSQAQGREDQTEAKPKSSSKTQGQDHQDRGEEE